MPHTFLKNRSDTYETPCRPILQPLKNMWESLYLPLLFLCCNWKLIKNVCLLPTPSLGLPKTTVHTRSEIISEVEFLYFYAHKFSVDNFNMEKIRILKSILF